MKSLSLEAGLRAMFSRHDDPDFISVFQQVINGLPEQIALVDEKWDILAVNPAWEKAAALYGDDDIMPGTNYRDYCEARAREGHKPANIAEGIRTLERSSERSFRYIYNGKDRWEGHSFQLCVNQFELDGRPYATITRYDVTELVHLRQLREDFSQSVIEHQAEERRRIAREVHDSTMQLLAAIGLSLGQLRRSRNPASESDIIEEIAGLLNEAQRELRTISYLAHPPMLSQLGLAKALTQMTGGLGRRAQLDIEVDCDVDLVISPAAEAAVFRFVQEALSNVHHHACATKVSVGLTQRHGILHVTVADDGIGMPEHVRRGVGLSSMSARIEEIGGRLAVRSGETGTTLIASLPAHAEMRGVGDLALPCAEKNLAACASPATCPHGHMECVPAHIVRKKEWLPGPDSNRRPSD